MSDKRRRTFFDETHDAAVAKDELVKVVVEAVELEMNVWQRRIQLLVAWVRSRVNTKGRNHEHG